MALQKPQAPWLTPQPGEQVLRVLGKLDPTAHGIAALGELGMGAFGAEHMGAHALTPAVPAIAGLMIARRLAELTGGVTERLQHFRDGRVFRPCQSNSGRLRMAETSSRRRLPTP